MGGIRCSRHRTSRKAQEGADSAQRITNVSFSFLGIDESEKHFWKASCMKPYLSLCVWLDRSNILLGFRRIRSHLRFPRFFFWRQQRAKNKKKREEKGKHGEKKRQKSGKTRHAPSLPFRSASLASIIFLLLFLPAFLHTFFANS